MTRVLSSIVSNQALDALSRRFNRAVFSRLIPKPISGPDSFGRRITGGAFEAFTGALYCEFGLDDVTFSVTAIMTDISTSIIAGKIPPGSSRIISRIGENTPLSTQGPPAPDHEPFFTVRVRLSGQESFEGSVPSLAEARKAAAQKALDSIGSDDWMTGQYTGFP
jgi:dsRNA-specific ribonuclease